MASTTGIKKVTVTDIFNGQADIVIFDKVSDYTTATFASVTAAATSLGQVVGGSTKWDGEEPTLNTTKDEQGVVIVTNPESGTYAFSCDVANLSKENLIKFLGAEEITTGSGDTAITSPLYGDITDLVKFGGDLPISTYPIGILNDEANRTLMFPKAKIIGSLSITDNKLWGIHLSATAEYIDTKQLGTCMTWKGQAKYES